MTTSRAATEYRYEKLTWPEINDAVDLGKICVLPCGAVEQHGHHLPLDVDLVCPGGIAKGAGQAIPDKMLVLPTFLSEEGNHAADYDSLLAGFRLTSFFLHRHVYEPRGIDAVSARDGFIQAALKALDPSVKALPPGAAHPLATGGKLPA